MENKDALSKTNGNVELHRETSLVEELSNVGSAIQDYWNLVKQYSNTYLTCLGFNGINDPRLKVMSNNDGAVAVETENYETIHLFIKNTCGPNGWEEVMQARTTKREIEGVGGGTTFFATLNPQEHGEVLQAIKNNKVKLIKKRFWP